MVNVEVTELDILPGGTATNLLADAEQEHWREQGLSGTFAAVVATPSGSSFSRALFSNADGPIPVRNFFHPRGLPRLPQALQQKAEVANAICDWSVSMMWAAAEAGVVGLLQFPEDLGATGRGLLASIWQLADVEDLSEHFLF